MEGRRSIRREFSGVDASDWRVRLAYLLIPLLQEALFFMESEM